ncbi:MAG TPA: SpoIIE family protein phosphatase [Vicinamibacterales bacterium]|nr:SpoIIE family protein phosphatase [Vicinamibacterales bacterium]
MTPIATAPPEGPPGRLGYQARAAAGLRRLAAGGWILRLVLAGAAIKLFAALVRWLLDVEPVLIGVLDVLGSIALVAAAVCLIVKLVRLARRHLLWRVRRKLILSYVFMGVVPSFLIVAFFLVAGLLLFLNVGSYLVRNGVATVTSDAVYVARILAMEVQRGRGPAGADTVLQQRGESLASRYPGASIVLVPVTGLSCPARPGEGGLLAPAPGSASAPQSSEPVFTFGEPKPAEEPSRQATRPAKGVQALHAGPWGHVAPPAALPDWLGCAGFGGLVLLDPAGGDGSVRGVFRGVGFPETSSPTYAIVVDIPKNDALAERLRESTSIKVGELTPVTGAVNRAPNPVASIAAVATEGSDDAAGTGKRRYPWVAWLEHTDWATGRTDWAAMTIQVNIADIYEQLSTGQARLQSLNVGTVLLLLLLVVGLLFLLIEAGALVMGLALARSITGSVHELFTGTERVRRGDFSHRIEVRTRDQLGELAESFNQMTASIEDLLRQAEEKKRLEEELRIAREIQMSLLPRGKIAIPGLTITTLCVPAREVGGDYYDILPIDDNRVAVLIADVAGKGTSAALYMAELKGVVLSLVRSTPSPRDLMIRANQIISEHLDSRAFITMTYAVLDLQARTMTYARAGHTPLIFRPANAGGRSEVQVLTPDGLVLGLRLDGGELFERLLQEESVPLGPGDLLLFFTDGISEAMNAESDMFGEARLAELVAEHGDLPPGELRERMLREIDAFVAGAPQHDDMTMILVKFDDFVPGAVRKGFEHAS